MNKLLIIVLIVGICILQAGVLCEECVEPMRISNYVDILGDCSSVIPLGGGAGGSGPPIPG